MRLFLVSVTARLYDIRRLVHGLDSTYKDVHVHVQVTSRYIELPISGYTIIRVKSEINRYKSKTKRIQEGCSSLSRALRFIIRDAVISRGQREM